MERCHYRGCDEFQNRRSRYCDRHEEGDERRKASIGARASERAALRRLNWRDAKAKAEQHADGQ